jgi:CRP-like cAMP-binding protein
MAEENPAAGIIAHAPMFRLLAPEHRLALARAARPLHLRRGETVVRRGERLSSLFAVGYGLLKLALRNDAGDEKVLRLVGPGETFGEAVLFLERPVPVDAIALVDTMLAAVPAAELLALLDADPRFARALLAGMSQRLHALVSDFEAATLHGAAQRCAGYLESLAPPGAEPCSVRLPATKTVIASRLGMTKETLSRLLRELAQAGLIRVRRREIALLDRPRLQRSCESGATARAAR